MLFNSKTYFVKKTIAFDRVFLYHTRESEEHSEAGRTTTHKEIRGTLRIRTNNHNQIRGTLEDGRNKTKHQEITGGIQKKDGQNKPQGNHRNTQQKDE